MPPMPPMSPPPPMHRRSKRRDDARRVDRQIRAIAVPAAIALATEPLFELCDTAILGHLGRDALGGASLAIRLLAFGHAVFVFLMFGTTTAVARRLGANDRRGAASEAVSAMWIAALIGTIGTFVFLVTGRWWIEVLGGTGEVASIAWRYLWINALGLWAFTMTMAGVGVRRGLLDTRTPLLVSAAASALNLVADLILVIGLGFGVGAAALTTTVAKVGSACVYAALVVREARRQQVQLTPKRTAVRRQLVVGRDLVVRTMLLRGAIIVAQSLAARRGATQLAAFAITFQIWMFTAYAADGLEAAGQSLVSHTLGSRSDGDGTTNATNAADTKDELLRLVINRLLRWGVVLGVAISAAVALSAPWVVRLFSAEADVRQASTEGLWWIAGLGVVATIAFVGDGILVGAGRQRFLAGAMIVATAAFALVAVVGADNASVTAIWAAMSAMIAVRAVAAIWGVRQLRAAK